MDIGTTLVNGLSSVFSGGALGTIGTIGTGILDFYKMKQQNAQDLAVRAAQLEILKVTGHNEETIAAIKALESSYDADKATYGEKPGLVDTVRGLTRPLLTMYLVLISTILGIWAFGRVTFAETIMEIAKGCIEMCLFLTSVAVVWWFGDRMKEKFYIRTKR